MKLRKINFLTISFVFLVYLLVGCKFDQSDVFEPIPFPKDNIYHSGKVELGRQLFFDTRLSVNNSISCATCHLPGLAFTDGLTKSEGIFGRHSMRNSPSLFNVAYQSTFMADGQVPTLEMQALIPLQDSSEMGNNIGQLVKKLRHISKYRIQSKELYNREFDAYVLTRSLAQFQRTLISTNSKFDQWYYRKVDNAVSENVKKGWIIFSEKLRCTQCHPAPFFTNFKVENNGLYPNYDQIIDKGRFRIHGDSSEIGSFKVPSLRNVSTTRPYMHDGSLKNLDEVIEHYAKGGFNHPNKSKKIVPFELKTIEKKQLKAFLESLKEDYE